MKTFLTHYYCLSKVFRGRYFTSPNENVSQERGTALLKNKVIYVKNSRGPIAYPYGTPYQLGKSDGIHGFQFGNPIVRSISGIECKSR